MVTQRTLGIDEPFELLQHLGTGAFAHTWRARVVDESYREDFGDEVALKIPLSKSKEKALRNDIEVYATLHLRLKNMESPHVVRYLGFGTFDNKIVMAMEYVMHGDLRQMLRRQKTTLPVAEAIKIAEGVLKGLAFIHHEHIFHRDIKPENILMDAGTPKVADLGIARMLSSNVLASAGSGTLPYMSPEMLGEAGGSYSSDIWSLGVTLYEMVTGRLPFGSGDTPPRTIIDLICSGEPTPAQALNDEVSPALNAVIMRALSKNPADRFSTADEMRRTLTRLRHQPPEEVERELAVLRARMGGSDQSADAETRLRDLLRRFPREASIYQCLGELYNQCGRHAEAIGVFEQGIARDTDNALLHFDLALANQKVGNIQGAIENLEHATALGLDASFQRHAVTLLKALRARGAR